MRQKKLFVLAALDIMRYKQAGMVHDTSKKPATMSGKGKRVVSKGKTASYYYAKLKNNSESNNQSQSSKSSTQWGQGKGKGPKPRLSHLTHHSGKGGKHIQPRNDDKPISVCTLRRIMKRAGVQR